MYRVNQHLALLVFGNVQHVLVLLVLQCISHHPVLAAMLKFQMLSV